MKKDVLAADLDSTQGIWSRSSGGVEIHRSGCAALNKATGRKLALWIRVSPGEVSEIKGRGYSEKLCGCVRKEAK